MKHGTKFCRKCKQVKKDCEFRAGRRQCNKCKDNTRNKIKGNFDDVIDEHVKNLYSLPKGERDCKLNMYVRDQLYKIATYCGVGRKYNDSKLSMQLKLIDHFDSENRFLSS